MSSTMVWMLVMVWLSLAYPEAMPLVGNNGFLVVLAGLLALVWDLRHW